jgi:hypothetical protein
MQYRRLISVLQLSEGIHRVATPKVSSIRENWRLNRGGRMSTACQPSISESGNPGTENYLANHPLMMIPRGNMENRSQPVGVT